MLITADSPVAGLSGKSGKIPAAVGILLLAASACTAQLILRLGLPVAHDMVFHLFQADQFYRDIVSGALLPRWAMSANNGYGSPNFIFYSPLAYYLAALFRVVAPSPVISVIISIWCGFFLSGAAMFLAVQRISGKGGALFSGVLYQSLPYHLLNLYGRGAFAELCAYAWFPLIILFLHETLSRGDSPGATAGLSMSYAGLVLTHLVSAFMFTVALVIYAACHFYQRRSLKALLRASSALFVGLGLSAFYLVPAMSEREFVQMDYLFNYVFSDYRHNFLFLKNAFSTPFLVALNGAAFLELLLFLAMVRLLLTEAFRENEGEKASLIHIKGNGDRPDSLHNRAICLIFICAFVLATPLSAPLWRFLPGFAVLQFPWRWVSVMESALCLLAGAALRETGVLRLSHAGRGGRMALYCTAALLSLSFVLLLKGGRMHAAPFLERITDAGRVSGYTNLPKEYTPIWATNVEKTVVEEKVDRVSALSGNAYLRILKWDPEKRAVAISASEPVLLRIATFFYPGWIARLDEKPCGIAVEAKSGAMLVAVPQGEHTLELSFHATPLRQLSIYVSLGSCFLLALSALFSSKKAVVTGPSPFGKGGFRGICLSIASRKSPLAPHFPRGVQKGR